MRYTSAEEKSGLLFEEGLEADVLRREIEKSLSEDLDFESGKILGSMCSTPDRFASEIYISQLAKNLGDPGLHPALSRMEQEAVSIIGSMLGAESEARQSGSERDEYLRSQEDNKRKEDVTGSIVSGGTEANIIAMWTAKLRSPAGKRSVVLPESAHFSFDKAASLMDLELRKIPVDRHHRFSLDEFRGAIDETTMAAVGIAGTTGLGIVDPIPEMAEIASEEGTYFHVDAAFGGFVLPFLEDAGYQSAPFDFSVPGVHSITIDPHKMGRAPIPSGCILFRNAEIAELSRTKVGYLAGGETTHQTIVGTRSGGAAAAVWASLRRYGRDGYVKTVRRSMETTSYLADLIRKSEELELMTEPFINVVGFRPTGNSDTDRVERAARELRERGFALSLFPGFLRISVMPHVTKKAIDEFWKEVKDAVSRIP